MAKLTEGIPIANFNFSKEDLQELVDEKVKEIELDIQAIRNKAIDDFLREIKIDVIATTFGLRICDAERIAQQLKAGGIDGRKADY